MEVNKNKSNIIIIILSILLVIAIGVICFLLISNPSKNNFKIDSENTEEKVENNEEKTEELMEMQPDENFGKIDKFYYNPKCMDSSMDTKNLYVDIDETKFNNISECIMKQKNVKFTISYCKQNAVTGEDESFEYVLTKNEMQEALNEMQESKYNIAPSGIGGWCVPGLSIEYERNNQKYSIGYFQFFALSSNDGNIYKILDKSLENTLSDPKNCLYTTDNLSKTISDISDNLLK